MKTELARASSRREPVVLLVPADSMTQRPMGGVAADMFRQVGMAVEYVAISFGNVLTRRLNKGPPAQGGWSAFASNPQGIDWLNPVGHQPLQGNATYAGWEGITAPLVLDSPVNAASFLAYVEQVLVPALRPASAPSTRPGNALAPCSEPSPEPNAQTTSGTQDMSRFEPDML